MGLSFTLVTNWAREGKLLAHPGFRIVLLQTSFTCWLMVSETEKGLEISQLFILMINCYEIFLASFQTECLDPSVCCNLQDKCDGCGMAYRRKNNLPSELVVFMKCQLVFSPPPAITSNNLKIFYLTIQRSTSNV